MTTITTAQAVPTSPAQKSSADSAVLTLRVRSVTYQTADINAYELVHPSGRELASFTAGSHIDVHLEDGRVRQYSLCNSPAEKSRYAIAVLNQPHGRGGSKLVHERLRAGTLLSVSTPRNNFALNEKAESHLLMAGGVGITPILSMVHRLRDIGADFKLHFAPVTRREPRSATRSLHLSNRAAFLFITIKATRATGSISLIFWKRRRHRDDIYTAAGPQHSSMPFNRTHIIGQQKMFISNGSRPLPHPQRGMARAWKFSRFASNGAAELSMFHGT